MTNIRRINLFAAAGAGKSSTAAHLFYQLKTLYSTLKIELVREYVKELAWEGKEIRPWDQLFITAEQMRREYNLLHAGVDVVVTDSPIELGLFYGQSLFGNDLDSLLGSFDEEFPSLNIWINRNDKPFFNHGRYESEDDARANDVKLKTMLKNEFIIDLHEFDFDQQDEIFEFVRKELGI